MCLRHTASANTIDRVPLTPRHGTEVRHNAGDPFDETLVGPSSAAWGRGPDDHGRVAYVTTDGGTTPPQDGTVDKPRWCASSWITATSDDTGASGGGRPKRARTVKTLSNSR